MLGVNVGSTFAGDADVKTMSPVGFDGNTLYVGGWLRGRELYKDSGCNR